MLFRSHSEQPSVAAGGTIGLSVQANKDGSFYMEFREEVEDGEKEFSNKDVPEVKIWASILTLQRIGGATIDFVERRFKLEVGGECCCASVDGRGCECVSHSQEQDAPATAGQRPAPQHK